MPRVRSSAGPATVVGGGLAVPCADGRERRYVDLDAAASTSAVTPVARRVAEFLPWYSSVHRGAGFKSQAATAAYEDARDAIRAFAARRDADDVVVICRNTTEAINHLAHSLRLRPSDVVVTTVVEHHANLLPWARVAERRFVDCAPDGTFDPAAVRNALDTGPGARLLDIARLVGAVEVIAGTPPPSRYVRDPSSGDYRPEGFPRPGLLPAS